jgi:hypothetical protein
MPSLLTEKRPEEHDGTYALLSRYVESRTGSFPLAVIARFFDRTY